MTAMNLLADICQRSLETLKMSLADFSEADMLVRPCAGANHAAWQVGHLIASEAYMVNACQAGATIELPGGFAERFNGKTAGVDDPAKLASKAELLELFAKVRGATVAWMRSLDEAALDRPGPERLRVAAPTVGHTAALVAQHLSMHLGQIQVIRRKLGKPVLF